METDDNKDSHPNTPEEIKKALMVQNYILRYKADKFNEKNWIFSDELKIALDSFEKKNEIIFRETKKSLKNYFKTKNLILPINWKEVFLDWFLNKYADDRYFLKDGTGHITKHLLDVIANREFYIEWARFETDKLLGIEKLEKQKQPKEIFSLSEIFKNKYGKVEGAKNLNDLKTQLFEKGVLSEDRTAWIGIGMHGVIQLASLIKFIGLKYFQTTFSEKQVELICEKDFNKKISKGSIKKGKSEHGEYYLI